jgi:hypothetical protein
MAPNKMDATIYRRDICQWGRMAVPYAELTMGSAQPGSFHAGLLFHSGLSPIGVVRFNADAMLRRTGGNRSAEVVLESRI